MRSSMATRAGNSCAKKQSPIGVWIALTRPVNQEQGRLGFCQANSDVLRNRSPATTPS